MQYLYMICSTGPRPDVAGDFVEMAEYFLTSARKHCPDNVVLLCNWLDIDDHIREFVRSLWGEKVQFFNIPPDVWEKQVAYHKINQMTKMPYEDGDEIIMLDVDTMVQGPLFDIFDKPFDIGITGRPVPEPGAPEWMSRINEQQPVNIGLVAFRWSEWVRSFVTSWAEQTGCPTWPPYVEMLEAHHRIDATRMCGDQDLICTIIRLKTNPFADVIFRDLGPKYNWYPDFDGLRELDKAWAQIEPKLGDPEYRVIHLKGHLKPLAPKIAKALECASSS